MNSIGARRDRDSHNISEQHLPSFLAEFDFRYLSDAERHAKLLKSAQGKRLVYQQPRKAANA